MAGRRGRGRGRGGDVADGPGDLEVLDPLTGEAMVLGAGADEVAGGGRAAAGVVRRRRLAVVLATCSVACALAAAYFVVTIVTLRGVERTWSQAMALDEARRAADGAVITTLDEVGDPDDHTAAQAALGRIGTEVAERLEDQEDDLRGRRIPDGKVDHLRDAMAEALRFRRFQLGPSRKLLGDTPLQKVEIELARQLDRFGMGRTKVAPPTLRSERQALAGLRRYVDGRTGTIVAALDDRGRLVTLDLDRSTYAERPLDVEAGSLFAVGDLAVVVGGGEAIAYPARDATAPAPWRVPADAAVVARSVPGAVLWRTVGDRVSAITADGSEVPGVGFTLPPGGVVIGDTMAGLVVSRPDGSVDRRDPATGERKPGLLPRQVIGTTNDLVLGRSPADRSLVALDGSGAVVAQVQLPGTAIGGVAASPADGSIAFGAGTRGGDLATVFLLLRAVEGGRPTVLLGLAGPRATVSSGGMAWSADGRFLFWLTPAGRLAVATVDGTSTTDGRMVRALTSPLRAIVALPSGR
jgi:hypothetical protein